MSGVKTFSNKTMLFNGALSFFTAQYILTANQLIATSQSIALFEFTFCT
jgi:hypothetical protein